jgi:hypothetical protein
MTATRIRTILAALLALPLIAALTGCESYAMKGHVIRGDVSYVEIVDADDERLDARGIPGVRVGAHLDPGRLNRKFLGSSTTDQNGNFQLPIDEFGAGFLEYDISVVAYKKGYMGAEQFFMMPPASKRVLVILAPGDDPDPPSFQDRESLFEEADRYR